MALEMSGVTSSTTTSQGPAASFEKLRLQIITLMGSGGFRALLTRALALAQNDVVWLRRAEVNADGILEAPPPPHLQISPEQMAEGSSIVLAHFLGLLVTFVGARITVIMVREAWPEISVDESEFLIEGSHEKSN